jgi:hypothetical protein
MANGLKKWISEVMDWAVCNGNLVANLPTPQHVMNRPGKNTSNQENGPSTADPESTGISVIVTQQAGDKRSSYKIHVNQEFKMSVFDSVSYSRNRVFHFYTELRILTRSIGYPRPHTG